MASSASSLMKCLAEFMGWTTVLTWSDYVL